MIFGIGLSRTGTNTLTACLRTMGLRAVHGQELDAHLFDRWWERPSIVLPAEIDAACETPYSRWFRAADRLHPGSRFIWTIREKQAWLDSLEQWLGRIETPAAGSVWFHWRMGFYGRSIFDRESMSDLYDQRHEAVAHYFRDRPGDLLTLDLIHGPPDACWRRLAEFVGREPPPAGTPLPHLNRRSQ